MAGAEAGEVATRGITPGPRALYARVKTRMVLSLTLISVTCGACYAAGLIKHREADHTKGGWWLVIGGWAVRVGGTGVGAADPHYGLEWMYGG
jgi:hypothetical protein